MLSLYVVNDKPLKKPLYYLLFCGEVGSVTNESFCPRYPQIAMVV